MTETVECPDRTLSITDLVEGARVEHVRSRGWYRIVGIAKVEATMEDVVVYRSDRNGSLWTRPVAEFIDGRFRLDAPKVPTPDGNTEIHAGWIPCADRFPLPVDKPGHVLVVTAWDMGDAFPVTTSAFTRFTDGTAQWVCDHDDAEFVTKPGEQDAPTHWFPISERPAA